MKDRYEGNSCKKKERREEGRSGQLKEEIKMKEFRKRKR